jgi:multisubunit Na+/H+ antiporter MnhF subunit
MHSGHVMMARVITASGITKRVLGIKTMELELTIFFCLPTAQTF